tara:strand:- start:46 stop:429 length:384 start_codon:yes stop_codon:yes gene_type:complete
MEAVKAMKEGKKVRRKEWGKDIAIQPACDVLCYYNCNDGKYIRFGIKDAEAEDWEIVKENPNSLSDKKEAWNTTEGEYSGYMYSEEDIKEHLKRFIDMIKYDSHITLGGDIDKKAKEEFGERIYEVK